MVFSFFFFSSDIWVFVFLGDIWVLRDHIFGEKNPNKKPIRERFGKGTLNTCTKLQGPKNGVDIWTLARLSAKITAWHRNYLVLAYIRFWALNLTSYWSYGVSSSIFCAKLCVALHLEAAGQ